MTEKLNAAQVSPRRGLNLEQYFTKGVHVVGTEWGLGRWLSSLEHSLLFQRTHILVYNLFSTSPRVSSALFWLLWVSGTK